MKMFAPFHVPNGVLKLILLAMAWWVLCAPNVHAQQDKPPDAQQDTQQDAQPATQQQDNGQSSNQNPDQGGQESASDLQGLLDQNQPPSVQVLDYSTTGGGNMPQLGEQPGMGRVSTNIPLPYSLSRGTGFALSAQTLAGYDSNFFLLPVDAQGNNFDGMQFLLHYDVASDRLGFQMNYTPGFTIYPGYPALTTNTQGYSQTLDYRWSNDTVLYWAAAGSRVPSYDGIFLPETLNVGAISVVLSNLVSSIANNTEIIDTAYSTLGVAHALGQHDIINYSGTGSWMELKQEKVTPGTVPFGLRDQTLSADIQYQHLLDLQRSVGLELTELYIRGMEPAGQQTTEVLMATYKTPVFGKTIASIGAGPLYTHASTHPSVLLKGTSYAATAGLSRQVKDTQFNVLYSRGYELGFVGGAYISHSIGGGFTTPLTHHLVANGSMGLVFSSEPSTTPGTPSGSFYEQGYTGRMDYKLNKQNALYFLYARSQFSAGASTFGYASYNRSQYSLGYTYTLSHSNREGQ
jgi:hypothetical protein